jgi:hypothetical protein
MTNEMVDLTGSLLEADRGPGGTPKHSSGRPIIADFGRFRPNWSTTEVLNNPRGEQTATLLQYGMVLVVGGLQRGGPTLVTLDSTELFHVGLSRG